MELIKGVSFMYWPLLEKHTFCFLYLLCQDLEGLEDIYETIFIERYLLHNDNNLKISKIIVIQIM